MYRPWSTWDRLRERCICFKGGGGSTEIPETEAQRASAEIAMKNYNDYMQTIRPVEDKYITDVTADPTIREGQVAGQITANIAQKAGSVSIDPNHGQPVGAVAGMANSLADSHVKGKQAVDSQRIAGFQSAVDMGMGKNSMAQLGMSNLASQSVADATNQQKINQSMYDSKMAAVGTAGGMALGAAKNTYDDSQKK